jgi:hypothetical protein
VYDRSKIDVQSQLCDVRSCRSSGYWFRQANSHPPLVSSHHTLLSHGPVESSKDKGKSFRLISCHIIHTCAIKTDPQVQIRLSIQRLRTLQEKRLALAKKSRREIADLLLKGRLETSKLRVEGLIQDDIYVELLELLEVRHVPSLRLSIVADEEAVYGETTS